MNDEWIITPVNNGYLLRIYVADGRMNGAHAQQTLVATSFEGLVRAMKLHVVKGKVGTKPASQ